MDSEVKTRHSSSIPSSLGKQIGVLPIGTKSSARTIGKSGKTVPVGGTDIVEGRHTDGKESRQRTGQPSPSSHGSGSASRSSQLSSYSAQSMKDDRTNSGLSDTYQRSPSDKKMTKTGLPPRNSRATSDAQSLQTVAPSGIETNFSSPDSSRSASSSKSALSKPPSSRVRNTKTSYTSPVSKQLGSPSNSSLKGAKGYYSSRVETKNESETSSARQISEIGSKRSSASKTGSVRTGSAQSRTLKSSSRTGSTSSTNTLTSQGGNDGVDTDSDSGGEQDVKFFDVQSQSMKSSRASSGSKQGARSKRGSGSSSATQRKQDGSKKPYKTIDPEEILAQNMESDFNKIYEINQHACELTAIENLDKFKNLKVLDLSCNFIDLIQNLEFNRELKELKLYDNRLRKIENLDCLRDLGSLQLQHNKIKTIGKGLTSLKKLQNLRIDCNRLLKIDTPELSSCVQLKVLDISYNMLDNLAALNYLPNLEELNASGNRIRSVSDLSKCKHLQEIDLSRNRITDLSGLKGLPKLLTLNVSFNAIVNLKSIGKLKQLQDLFATNNRIHDLSCLPTVVPKLEVLDLTENEISDWDEMYVLEDLPDLVELFLSGNPFCEPDGPMPHYYSAITTIVPDLEIIDGAHIKKHVSKGAPLMRPMSASSIVSLRQMDSQMKSSDEQMESLEKSLEEKFAALRATCDSLPSEPHHYHDFSFLNRPDSGNSSVPSSRCSTRSRLSDAKAFAASTNFD